jgi:spore coat protein U-like protein
VNRIARFCLALCCLASATEARSACSTAATSVDFGAYNVADPVPTDTVGSMTVECDRPALVSIAIGPSSATGSVTPRQMRLAGGDDRLNYNLYLDPSFTAVWGDGTGGGAPFVRPVVPRRPWHANIYGRIPPGQNVSAGPYGDTLFVTIFW